MNHIRLCANKTCGQQFETAYDNKIYCSSHCKMAAEHRRYRQSHKEKFRLKSQLPHRKAYMVEYRKRWALEHKVFIDGATSFGPWGIMCPSCHAQYGMGLGGGRGQKYEKQGDKYYLVAGGMAGGFF